MEIRLVALLRGINVGTSKRVPMSSLRELLVDLGYTEVRTCMQSGNAVFDCPAPAAATAGPDIKRALAQGTGVKCSVIVRTAAELNDAMANDPLLDTMTDPARHLVGFLAGDPEAAALDALAALDVAPDNVSVIGRHAYLWCPAGVLASPLSKVIWGPSLGGPATMRNWSTVTRIAALAKS